MSSVNLPRVKETIRSAPNRNIERCYSENIPSRIMMSDSRSCSTPNREVKSKYCLEELKKPAAPAAEHSGRASRTDSAPVKRQETKDTVSVPDESRIRDVMFLRKMLAINKKQEMMLNKRLAMLLEVDEFQNFSETREKTKHIEQPPLPSPPKPEVKAVEEDEDEKRVKYVSNTNENEIHSKEATRHNTAVVQENPLPVSKPKEAAQKTKKVRRVQYDINGRRVYHYSDVEKDSTEEEMECKQKQNNSYSSKYSSKTHKKGSTSSKKFTMKKSLTYINTQSSVLKKPTINKRKSRKDYGDSPSAENTLDCELKPKKVGCQGDGAQVQNVVVHCSTVFRNNSTSNKNVKVWNYESLPSLKSENCLGKKQTVYSDQRLEDVGGHNSRNRPISVRNSNFQIQFQTPPSKNDERGQTVETVFLVRKKFSDIKN